MKKGFSLVEIIVVVAIFTAIFLAVMNFGEGIFSFNRSAQNNLMAQSDARRVLKTMVREMRSSSPSSLGAYPLSQAGTSSITFFSNIDNDSDKEQIRYFIQGTDLKKGTVNPSGSPLSYNQANEQVITLIRDVANGSSEPVFEYFDSFYTGTSSPLVMPVQATRVRLVRMTIKINKNSKESLGPVEVKSQVFLRNLKDNL